MIKVGDVMVCKDFITFDVGSGDECIVMSVSKDNNNVTLNREMVKKYNGHGIGVIAKSISLNMDEEDVLELFDFKKRRWTEWEDVDDYNYGLNNDKMFCSNNLFREYRTNGKRVQVRNECGMKSEAVCCVEDEFDLDIGLEIAMARLNVKEVIQPYQ